MKERLLADAVYLFSACPINTVVDAVDPQALPSILASIEEHRGRTDGAERAGQDALPTPSSRERRCTGASSRHSTTPRPRQSSRMKDRIFVMRGNDCHAILGRKEDAVPRLLDAPPDEEQRAKP